MVKVKTLKKARVVKSPSGRVSMVKYRGSDYLPKTQIPNRFRGKTGVRLSGRKTVFRKRLRR